MSHGQRGMISYQVMEGREIDALGFATDLNERHAGLSAERLIEVSARDLFSGALALVSSFGADSAVLLHLVAQVDRTLPVIFIDTLRHFPETLAYRDVLVALLKLEDVRVVGPSAEAVQRLDPQATRFSYDPDGCCAFRKVEPLDAATAPFKALISGRKRFQAATRRALRVFEAAERHIKINPLAAWGAEDIEAYRLRHALPPHPLVAQGFPSIGCEPCTSRVASGEDVRSGRWRGFAKTECGIHQPVAMAAKRT